MASRERYNYEIQYAIQQQQNHKQKLEEDLKGCMDHGGFGQIFFVKLKILFYVIFGIVVLVGLYIGIRHPNLIGTYAAIVLPIGILYTVAVIWRKVENENL